MGSWAVMIVMVIDLGRRDGQSSKRSWAVMIAEVIDLVRVDDR
jgi:hypothetical protein